MTPSPFTRHYQLSIRLILALGNFLELHPFGELCGTRFDCVMSLFDIVEPDLAVVLNDQAHIITKKNIQGAPALVVEIASPATRQRDRRQKRDLYARAGVREYWIVDPDANSVAVFRRTPEGRFPPAGTLYGEAGDRP